MRERERESKEIEDMGEERGKGDDRERRERRWARREEEERAREQV